MGNVILIKAGKSVILRTDQKFWMVVFRNIPNKEIPKLDWYNCMRKRKLLVNLDLHVT